ncbi:MAG: DUF1302 family protein, partial [Acetobacteraceae bacterium]|nr:DUF1302 family protein [Acetobacteraceae bacterium]
MRDAPSLAASWGGTAALAARASTPISRQTKPRRRGDKASSRLLVAAAIIACGLGRIETAASAELWTSGNLTVRLDTTAQFTALRRLSAPQARLLADPNGDDADRNFASGPASNRTDIFSELDIDYGTAGVRFSGAGWYDPVYFRTNANNSPATFNPFTVPHNHFTQATQGLDGLDAELLDAFVHDTFNLDDKQVGVRIGRHTLIWGESLFFGANGIAIGQAPIDYIKAASVPNTPARELFL